MADITLQQIDELLKKRLSGLPTKDDLKDFARKDDLKGFATKKDLNSFATKDDLRKELSKYATKDELRKVLEALKKELIEHSDQLFADLFESTDKRKADKTQVKQLEKRVVRLEDQVISS